MSPARRSHTMRAGMSWSPAKRVSRREGPGRLGRVGQERRLVVLGDAAQLPGQRAGHRGDDEEDDEQHGGGRDDAPPADASTSWRARAPVVAGTSAVLDRRFPARRLAVLPRPVGVPCLLIRSRAGNSSDPTRQIPRLPGLPRPPATIDALPAVPLPRGGHRDGDREAATGRRADLASDRWRCCPGHRSEGSVGQHARPRCGSGGRLPRGARPRRVSRHHHGNERGRHPRRNTYGGPGDDASHRLPPVSAVWPSPSVPDDVCRRRLRLRSRRRRGDLLRLRPAGPAARLRAGRGPRCQMTDRTLFRRRWVAAEPVSGRCRRR